MTIQYNSKACIHFLITMLLALCYYFELKYYFWFGTVIFAAWVLLYSCVKTYFYVLGCAKEYEVWRRESNEHPRWDNDECDKVATLALLLTMMFIIFFVSLNVLQFVVLLGVIKVIMTLVMGVSFTIFLVATLANLDEVEFVVKAIRYRWKKKKEAI